MPTPIGISLLHYFLGAFAMIVNCALFLVILTRTPNKMKTYSAVLATSAVVDFLSAATSCVAFVKAEWFLIYAFTGPCTYSFLICKYSYALTLCGHAFFAYSLTICFCFRLVAIRGGSPSARTTFAAVAVALFPNVCNYYLLTSRVEFVFGDELHEELAAHNRPIEHTFIYYRFKDLSDPLSLLSLGLFTTPYTPAHIVIVLVFRKIKQALDAATSIMSARTKAANVEIVKGLVIQSCLPIIDICAVSCFLAFLVFEIKSAIAEHAMTLCIELVCLLHPLISLYYVRPYRIAVWNCLSRSKAVSLDFQTSVSERKISVIDSRRRKATA